MFKFTGTFGANFNKTDVTAIPDVPVLDALNPAPTLFGRVNIKTFEEGTPKSKFTASLDWEKGAMSGTVRATRYGDVLVPNSNAANDYTLDPKILIDLEGRWDVNQNIELAIGADNLLDEYPDASPVSLNGTGNVPFSTYSPFGYSGRFVYGKATVKF